MVCTEVIEVVLKRSKRSDDSGLTNAAASLDLTLHNNDVYYKLGEKRMITIIPFNANTLHSYVYTFWNIADAM